MPPSAPNLFVRCPRSAHRTRFTCRESSVRSDSLDVSPEPLDRVFLPRDKTRIESIWWVPVPKDKLRDPWSWPI